MGVEVRTDTRRLTQLMQDMEPHRVGQMLLRAGFEAEGLAKMGAPIDTGYLRSSLGTKKVSDSEVQVGASANYAAYVEMGTRYTKAHPYLAPAVKVAVGKLINALEAMFRRAQ